MKRTSLKNIAEKLAVSTATVSLVLSGKEKEGRVSKEVADKIRQVALEMNYQPNGIARSLRMGCSQTIGLIVADISNLFFASLAFCIQEEAEKLGYTVIITNTNESDKKMEFMINTLRNRQVDGFIIVPTENGEESVQKLVDNKVPLVLLDRYFPFIETSYVVTDSYKASLDAIRLLIGKGCRRTALLIYKNNLPHMLDRRNGYSDALLQAGLYDGSLIKEIRYSHIQEDIEQAIKELLDSDLQVDSIFFATNSISMLGLKYLLTRNAKVLDELKVVCFDKSDAFDLMSVPIPYVMQPIEAMGQKAVCLVIEQIEKKSLKPLMCKLPAKLLNE